MMFRGSFGGTFRGTFTGTSANLDVANRVSEDYSAIYSYYDPRRKTLVLV